MKNVAQRRRESHQSYFFLLLPSGWHVVAARSSRWPHVWKRPFWSAGCFTPTGFYALCPCLIQCCCFHLPQQHLDKLRRPGGRWRRRHTANFSNTHSARAQTHIVGILTFKGAGPLWPPAACHFYTLLTSAFQVFFLVGIFFCIEMLIDSCVLLFSNSACC